MTTHEIGDALDVERFADALDEVHRTRDDRRIVLRGEADDGNRRPTRILLLVSAELDTIHDGHHEIEQDHAGLYFVQPHERLAPIAGGDDGEPLKVQVRG